MDPVRGYVVQHNFLTTDIGFNIIECFDRCAVEVNDQIPIMGGRQVAQLSYPFGDWEGNLVNANWVFATPLGDEACQMYLAKILRDCADFHETTADGFAEAMIQAVHEKRAELIEGEADVLAQELSAEIEAGLLHTNPDNN